MKSLGWADAAWAAGICAAAVAAFFVFRTPEPARTGLWLIDLVCERSPERAAAIAQHVADPLELTLPPDDVMESERQLSRADVTTELARLDLFLPRCSFGLDDWSIRDGSGGSAWLEGVLEYSDSQPGDLHGRRRPMRALFREVGGEQRLERVWLGPIERRLPEARP
ncbi:MAG TPA: hypothetical protein VMG12_28090 [Polyangiaceae bacterium]|nr:hypothetical protein [Polyangiaceae bacterium]